MAFFLYGYLWKRLAQMANGIPSEDELRKREESDRKRNQKASEYQKIWESISSEIFGISGAGFWEKMERSSETMAKLAREANSLKGDLENARLNLGEEIEARMGAIQSSAAALHSNFNAANLAFNSINLSDFRDELDLMSAGPLRDTLDQFDTLEEKFQVLRDLATANGQAIAQYPEGIRASVLESLGMMGDLSNQHEILLNTQREYNRALDDANEKYSKGLNIMGGLNEMSQNLRNSAIKAVFEWDKVANSIQRESGILLSEMSAIDNMNFTSEMARFGMSLREAGQMVGEIGESLQTTSIATKDMALAWGAVSMATGVSTKEVAEMGASLIKLGYSTEQVNEYFEGANSEAKMLGVNSRKVLQSINRNLTKMKAFGFVDGEESLVRMAARAEQLRVNIDDIFDVAERARTIEGAMQMAADLQLAAGSFSNLNPMDLLAAARKGPEELQRLLATMGSDIGRFNKDGTFEIDPIDGDRLRIAAEAVGLNYQDMFSMIERNALDMEKTKFFSGQLDFSKVAGDLEMDPETLRSSFADLFEMDGNGGIKMTTDGEKLLEKVDVQDWRSMNSDQLKDMFKLRKDETKSLEEQATSNMSLRQSMDALVQSLTNSLTIFQPLLEWAAEIVNSINGMFGGAGKAITASLVIAIPLIGKIMARGLSLAFASRIGGGAGSGISSLASGLRTASGIGNQIDRKGLLKFAAALGIIGVATLGFSIAMAKWGGEASMGQMVTAAASLAILGTGVWALSEIAAGIDMGNVLKGALAMGIIGASLIPFAFALNMMGEVNSGAVLASIAFMGIAVLGVMALGSLAVGAWPLLLAGAVALIAIGGMLLLASYSLLVAGEAFEKLASINWEGLSGMGGALMSAAPGMLAFGLASLAFANPLSILGMLAMTGNLALLNTVMNPLAISLDKAATSMEKFVEAMDKMKTVVKDIDTGKLEEMRELADAMSKSARSNVLGNIAEALSNAVSGGSGGSNGGVREIKIKLIGDNGREIKHKILEDTATQSGR